MPGDRSLPDETPDEVLVARFKEGDDDAFATLVRRHEDRLFALSLRMIGERAGALDAVQETFLTAFKRIDSFRGDAQFGTWLYRIAVNSCHDLIRRRKRWSRPEGTIEDAPHPGAGLDETAALRIDVAQALAALPPEFREAVVLHDLAGLPYEEVAAVTKVAVGTVKSRISRGRRRLAEQLEQAGRPAASKEQP
ncbi:sigma-70 family RNA polymerase sigma factor [soil metagenome]